MDNDLQRQLKQIQRSLGFSQLHNPLTSNPSGQPGAGQLTLGGNAGGLGNFNVYSGASDPGPGPSSSLVAWMGAMVDSGTLYWGIWGTDIFLGGTGPHNALTISADISGTPTNTTTPAKWVKVHVAGVLYYLPLYQ